MPNTFCHPAAVLVCGRRRPAWLGLAGLVAGSVAPDAGYYVRQFDLARSAHGLVGSVTLSLPAGLLLLGVFLLVRESLCGLLPQPHRGALLPLAQARPDRSLRGLAAAAVSVYAGIWTHIIWDAFTHEGTPVVDRIALLRQPVLEVADAAIPLYNVLQHLSTLLGLSVMVVVYLRWLRTHRAASPPSTLSDGQRYGILAALVVLALALGVPAAARTAAGYEGYLALRVLLVRSGIYSAAVFLPALVLTALVLRRAKLT